MNQYWATADDIADKLKEKKDDYWKFLSESGILDELRTSFSMFYGNSAIDELSDGKTVMTANHYASLVRALHTLVTQNRPAFEARAMNTDYKSQAATILSNGILDYYLREKKLEDNLKEACLLALFLREGWIVADWDPSAGNPYAVNPDTQQPINTGDVVFKTYGILDIIRPVSGKQTWNIIRTHENKYDLAAKYPELAEKLITIKDSFTERRKWSLSYIADSERDSDNIEVLTLMHSATPALPAGRMVICVSDIVLLDTPLPYKRPYVFAIKAMDAYQTSFGHSPAMDLMPLQDALDSCFSIALSNINSFGIGNIISEKGSLQVKQIKDGLLHLEHSKGSAPPSVLNMLQIPGEIFKFAEMLMTNQETISAVNATARGNVQGDMSGTAMALIAQQALTFSSGLQQSYNALIESTGTALIELMQTFANVPIVAQIAGKSKRAYMATFKSEDLQGINKIVVDSANAFTKTTAGKVEVANNLLNSGLINTPEQYLQVVTTGNLEPLVEHDQSQIMLIRSENELLAEGQQVTAIMTDDHGLHVLEHSVVINDPQVRQDVNILQATLNHIQEHINLAQTQPPILAMMLGRQPMQQPIEGQPAPAPNVPPQDMQSATVPEPAQPPGAQ